MIDINLLYLCNCIRKSLVTALKLSQENNKDFFGLWERTFTYEDTERP